MPTTAAMPPAKANTLARVKIDSDEKTIATSRNTSPKWK